MCGSEDQNFVVAPADSILFFGYSTRRMYSSEYGERAVPAFQGRVPCEPRSESNAEVRVCNFQPAGSADMYTVDL